MTVLNKSSATNKPIFRLQNCQLGYSETTILRDVNLDIFPGESIAIIGKSGSGKTTLLKHLQTLRPNESAFCPQEHGLVPVLSVFHNIYMGQLDQHSFFYNMRNLIMPKKNDVNAVREIAKKLQIEPTLFTSIDQLSGGQQQRVNIGRALFQKRPIFIGDEPTSSTDRFQGKEIVSLIDRQHETVVLALHDIDLALSSCRRIIGIKEHRIAMDAPSKSLKPEELHLLYQ